jgi:hypothetical protein
LTVQKTYCQKARKTIQQLIFHTDVALEALKLWIVRGTNYHINRIQYRLFLADKWLQAKEREEAEA